MLHIDPGESYIYIAIPGDSQTFAVSGGGALNLLGESFMSARIYPEDGELGGDYWSDWYFTTTEPIHITPDGNEFTVPEANSPKLFGSGYQNSTEMFIQTFMAEDASGSFQSGNWEVDFSQVRTEMTVHLHLEGEVEELE